jgi:UDP-glucose 4-epimerase
VSTRRSPGQQVRDLRLRSVIWPDVDAMARTPLAAGLRATADDVAARTRSATHARAG